MLPLKVLQQMVGILLITYLVAGCGSSPSASVPDAPAAQATSIPPTIASTVAPPTPTPQSGPKAGHWEGEQPKVSFEVTDDGKIRNFTMVAPAGQNTCNLKLEEDIVIEADGTFAFIKSVDTSTIDKNLLGLAQAMGNAPEVTKTASGEMIDLQRIEGKFDSDTSVSGSYKLNACGDTLTLSSGSAPSWKAALKG